MNSPRRPATAIWTPADWAWAGGLLDVLLPILHSACRWWRGDSTKFDPEEAFALMADAGAQRLHPADRASHAARGAKPARPLRSCAAHHRLWRRSRSAPRPTMGARGLRPHHQRILRPDRMQSRARAPARRSASRKPGAIGKPVPGQTVAVIGARRRALQPDEVGQIAIRSAGSGDVPRILGQAARRRAKSSSATG